jgi:putative membrane protein
LSSSIDESKEINVAVADTDQKDIQQQLAEERTETAHRRTFLADERTYSAWVRTGLASLATGFAIAKLMVDSGPAWMIRVLGILFVATGGVMFVMAFWTYRRAMTQRKQSIDAGIPTWIIATLTLALLVGTATGLAFVFVG